MTDITAPDPAAFLMGGGGAPTAKFPAVGTVVKGTVVSTEVTQQTDLEGNPKFWNDGGAMWQLVVTLQTDERDADIEDDDGTRRLFLKGSKKPGSKSSLGAVTDAVRAAKASNLEVGGTLQIAYVADGEPPSRGFNPPKLYEAKYVAPSPTAASADLFD